MNTSSSILFQDLEVGGQAKQPLLHCLFFLVSIYTDKKENKIFLRYKEIQKGAVAKSYMTNGLLICD